MVALQLGEATGVLLGLDEFEQFQGVGHPSAQVVEFDDGGLEAGTLTAQFLGAVRGVPDPGVLQLAVYLLEPFLLVLVFKDTPSAP